MIQISKLISASCVLFFLLGCSNQSKDSNTIQSNKNVTVPTSQKNDTKTAGVNGCTYEELAYSKGYAEGTKAINRKGHSDRNTELYVLRGGCDGSANVYNILKNRHPAQYPQSTEDFFGLCTNGTIDGFDQKVPQQYHKKECEDKPLVDKNKYK